MRLSALAALMIITTVLLSACSQDHVAELQDRSHQYFGRNAAAMAVAGFSYSAPTYQPPAQVDAVSSAPLAPPIKINNAAMAPGRPVASNAWTWPVDGRLTECFGQQANGIANEGITIAAAEGSPIHAAAAGEVAYVGTNVRDYGTMVILRHPDGELTSYAHAQSISVAKGDHVLKGDVIGLVGQTGGVKTPQLHFAMRDGDHAIDPLSKLPQQMASR